MSIHRSHNFSAGPAALPLAVLEKAQAELTDFRGAGASIMELSHRGKEYIDVDAKATAALKRLLGIGDEFEVMYLQGGASTQFMMAPMNLLTKDQTADYIVTGEWAKKAAKEAKRFGTVNVAYTSEATNFDHVPVNEADLKLTTGAQYLHFTSNNTIFGTEFFKEPKTAAPLICDASSDFLSRPIDMSRYGMIYAGAQKNLGPAGVTIVIARKEFLSASKASDIPTILDYKTHMGTMFNTPPVFAVYMVGLVLEWLEAQGGVTAMEKINIEKASLLYGEIDRDGFYRGTARNDSRSRMNVTFRLPNEELENKFAKESEKAGLIGLKGHRSVGGMRASIYNAVGLDSVKALVDFMKEFRAKNG